MVAKKPKFKRQYSSYKKRGKVQTSWRKPRGIDSAQRRKRKDKGAHPNMGYSSPKKARGLHPSGLSEVIVRNVKDASSLGKGSAARIASSVGKKKRQEILKACEEKKVKVLNG